jgi:hypothetical protein
MEGNMEDNMIVSLLPFVVVTILFFCLAYPICRRKGKTAYALICLIPFVGWFALIYFASLPDKQVLDRLAALETKR